jgi:hypothetical protein
VPQHVPTWRITLLIDLLLTAQRRCAGEGAAHCQVARYFAVVEARPQIPGASASSPPLEIFRLFTAVACDGNPLSGSRCSVFRNSAEIFFEASIVTSATDQFHIHNVGFIHLCSAVMTDILIVTSTGIPECPSPRSHPRAPADS